MNRPASFRAVKFLPLFAIALLTGCQTHYTKFTVTDFQGNRSATWIAEGPYTENRSGYVTFTGYNIRAVERTAVERTAAQPHELTNHYPNGWKTTVTGENIIRERVEKPDWLKQLDGQ